MCDAAGILWRSISNRSSPLAYYGPFAHIRSLTTGSRTFWSATSASKRRSCRRMAKVDKALEFACETDDCGIWLPATSAAATLINSPKEAFIISCVASRSKPDHYLLCRHWALSPQTRLPPCPPTPVDRLCNHIAPAVTLARCLLRLRRLLDFYGRRKAPTHFLTRPCHHHISPDRYDLLSSSSPPARSFQYLSTSH